MRHTSAARCLAGWLLCAGIQASRGADSLTPKAGAPVTGVFQVYQNDRFELATPAGQRVALARTMTVSLTLDPPLRIVLRPATGKTREDLRLTGYDKTGFHFADPAGAPLRMSAAQVRSLRAALDFERGMALQQAAAAPPDQPAAAGAGDPAIHTGAVTLVLFHMPAAGPTPATRMENAARTLAAQSGGRVVLSAVAIRDAQDPALQRHGLASLPQFWFYNRAGRLVRKLADRFTETDLEAALKEARR